MVDLPSLEEMWKVIEGFGISRKMIDPNNSMASDEVQALYLTIIDKNKD
ncbi:MAG TPA: hypothetical protein VJ792_00385 [Candidatus Nitrosotalea sp.]|nr:hypothetical protein [Candidatus Nitrosotalea sp.]